MNQNDITRLKAKSIIAFMSGWTAEDVCPLCDGDSIFLVSSTIRLDVRGHGPLVVEDWRYCACENPECEFEFVGPEQARHNDNRVTVEKVLQR